MFEPNQKAALDALHDFLPRAGREYTSSRNYDYGTDRRQNVSVLSPWVRVRLLPEWTIIREVLKQHSSSAASKFVDEVCWRTYWKGWLQQHPSVWDDYLAELETARREYGDDTDYEKALAGETGIECFDTWTQELIDTGYLHNHARMWYASIWIHTLKLPWVLGAAFFLKHLYDGDPASNTLSWRWVAGLHTQGKTYLARPDNIKKYTDGRFRPEQSELAREPLDLAADYTKPDKMPIAELPLLPKAGWIGLLVQDDDLSALDWLAEKVKPVATCGLFAEAAYREHDIAPTVADFRRDCLASALPGSAELFSKVEEVVDWAQNHQLETVVLAEPAVGLWNTITPELRERLEAKGIALNFGRHWWDAHFFPQAGAGFFKLKKAIPGAIEQL